MKYSTLRLFFLFLLALLTHPLIYCRKHQRLNASDFSLYNKWDYKGPQTLSLSQDLLEKVQLLKSNTNPLIGFLGIPIHFREKEEHVRGTYVGCVDNKETSFAHAYIPE